MPAGYIPGSWRAICDRCGGDYHAHELRLEWTGLRTCVAHCWEERHPQDFVRGVKDKQSPPWTRPAPEPVYLDTNDVSADDL